MNAGYQENLLNDVNADLITFTRLCNARRIHLSLWHIVFPGLQHPGGIPGSTECV